MNLATHNEGCPCIDVSNVLSSLVERSCQTSDGQDGIMLQAEGPCVPPSFGSGGCLLHDKVYDPKCKVDDTSLGVVNTTNSSPEEYCLRPWCYVDAETCMRYSSERVYRSDYFPRDMGFPRDQGVDLFYSYSTCGSTADDWLDYQGRNAVGGRPMTAAVPTYSAPLMYKRDPASGEILTSSQRGSEYFNSSSPFEGIFMEYLDSLMEIAEGDLNITYTYASNAGRLVHPTTKYTAAIQDIEDGLRDMAIGSFWVTGQRLKMTSFTVPLYYDKTVLVIPQPKADTSVTAQASKVLEPFELAVWVLIILLITITALLSVWFTRFGRGFWQVKRRDRIKKGAYARVALDEFLKKGTFFCSAGVTQDSDTPLPQKLLLFGFAFFILIVVSSYVANLAAFLTRPVSFVGTIEAVNQRGIRVCAHPALKKELEVAWPEVKFVFSKGSYSGMLDDYSEQKCAVLAVGASDITSDADYTKAFCEKGLVLTDSLIIETPVAFPIRPGLVSGLSYWMQIGEKNYDITFDNAMEKYNKKNDRLPYCDLMFSNADNEASDYARISPQNLFLPFVFFMSCAVLAVVLQIWYQWSSRKGKESVLVGRVSTLDRQYTSRFDCELASTGSAEVQRGDSDSKSSRQILKKSVKFSVEDFNDNADSEKDCASPLNDQEDTSRVLHEILRCVHDIKRQKETVDQKDESDDWQWLGEG